MDDATKSAQRLEHFSKHWLSWIALRHFLPNPYLKSLCEVLFTKVSEEELRFSDVFQDRLLGDELDMQSWLVKPNSEKSSPIGIYLRNRVQDFVWKNDRAVHLPEVLEKSVHAQLVERSIQVGAKEFLDFDQELIKHDLAAGVATEFLTAIECVIKEEYESPSQLLFQLNGHLETIPFPLSVVISKHIGDLFSQIDELQYAFEIYMDVCAKCKGTESGPWSEFVASFLTITRSSAAVAKGVFDGPEAGYVQLKEVFQEESLSSNPLLFANSSFDAEVFFRKASETPLSELSRSTYLEPQLAASTYSGEEVIFDFLTKDFENISRRMSTSLRRLVAVGASHQVRNTKAVYALSLIGFLDKEIESHNQPDVFRQALCLLIESEGSKLTSSLAWKEQVVDHYVSLPVLRLVVEHATKHAGVTAERSFVVIELFRSWLKVMSLDRSPELKEMVLHLFKWAGEGEVSLFSSKNLGGRSIEVLTDVASDRPEVRSFMADTAVDMLAKRISEHVFWKARSEALELAEILLDVLSDEDILKLANAVMGMLDDIGEDPVWVLVRPALAFLSSKQVKQAAAGNEATQLNVINHILSFGLRQESEQAATLASLESFNPELLKTERVRQDIQVALDNTKENAQRTNSSSAPGSIQALLLSSAVSGASGVEVALSSFEKILRGVDPTSSYPNMNLAASHRVLLVLENRLETIAKDLDVHVQEFMEKLEALFPLVEQVWRSAKINPLVFSGFSIPPPQRPNENVVHNWAYSSLIFAKVLGLDERIERVLKEAEDDQPSLCEGIANAWVTYAASGFVPMGYSVEKIATESRDVFYGSIGQRLASLESDREELKPLLQALVTGCVRLGPHAVDAAVFLKVLASEVTIDGLMPRIVEYRERLRRDRGLQYILEPILRKVLLP